LFILLMKLSSGIKQGIMLPLTMHILEKYH
jgi:hypothetical protein